MTADVRRRDTDRDTGGLVVARLKQLQAELGSAVGELKAAQWAGLVKKKSGGFSITGKTLLRYLSGEHVPSWEAFVAIASTDEKGRGPAWLAGWIDDPNEEGAKKPRRDATVSTVVQHERPSTRKRRRGA